MKRSALVVVLVLLGIVGLLAVSGGVAEQELVIASPVGAAVEDPGPSVAAADASTGAQLLAWDAAVERARVEEARLAEEARVAEVARVEAEREAERRAAAASAVDPAPISRAAVAPSVQYGSSLYPCGGDLPPCWVAQQESGGNYSAFNPGGCSLNGRSGCYGKWQFGWFWGGKLGLPVDLSTATPEQQDNAARLLWNGGRGCSNWGAC